MNTQSTPQPDGGNQLPLASPDQPQTRILVGICTCNSQHERKQAVRNTWLRHIPDGIRCLFFTGSPANEETPEPDTVILPVDDGYKALPQKVMAFFRYALEHEDFDWLFKCDDDTYVALDRLASIIQPGYDLFGDISLQKRNFPSGGAGYMLPRSIIQQIVEKGSVPNLGPEDILIGREAMKFGARPCATERLCLHSKLYPLPGNTCVTSHWCSPEHLHAIDRFYRESPCAIYHGRHARWTDNVHFYHGGYYRRTETNCYGTCKIDATSILTLHWFNWPEEHLSNIHGTYTNDKLVLTHVSGELPGAYKTPDTVAQPLYIQLGCSTNGIPGWLNLDLSVFDITQPLPWNDGIVDALFLEHVIEHISTDKAYAFLQEAWRTLKPGGILRLSFPDLLRIATKATPAYIRFLHAQGWGDGSPGSALKSIIVQHGHKAIWTRDTMLATLRSIGFDACECLPGESSHKHMKNLERYNIRLGMEFNLIETTCVEARKPAPDKEQLTCVFLLDPRENMEGTPELQQHGYRIIPYPTTQTLHLTDTIDLEFEPFIEKLPSTCELRHVRSLRQSFANMITDPAWNDDDFIIFGESDSTPVIDANTLRSLIQKELEIHPEADVLRLFHCIQTTPSPTPEPAEQPAFETYRTAAQTLNTPYVWGTHALVIPTRSRQKVANIFTAWRLPIDTALEAAQSRGELNIRVALHDFFYQKKRTAKITPNPAKKHRIAVCLSSYKRFEDLQRQIFCMMAQSYDNFHLFVAVKGISEMVYHTILLPNFRHWIEEGRLTMRYYPNKNQLSNFVDTIRGIDISEYDLFAKVDDDDFYSREYLQTVNNFHATIPEGHSSHYSDLSLIRYSEKGHVCFRAVTYTVFGASMVLDKKVMHAVLRCEADPENEIPAAVSRNGKITRSRFGFAEDHLYHILMEEAGCSNRAEYIKKTCLSPHIIVQKNNTSVMRGGLLDHRFISQNKTVSTNPANHEHILELHHPDWHDLIQIIGDRGTRISHEDQATIVSLTSDSLTVRWNQWGEETFAKQPDGMYRYKPQANTAK